MVANVVGVVSIQKLKRAIVQGQAQNAHVVGVHHTMAKPHTLPFGHHLRGALGQGLKPCHRGLLDGQLLLSNFREMLRALGLAARVDLVAA
jgi:hypothetical protein